MKPPPYEEDYEDYVRACLRDRFHEDHPRKANGLLTELAEYRDPILATDRKVQRYGSDAMYPSDEEDVQACLPQLRKAIAALDDPALPRPVPDLGKIGTVYILIHPAFTAWVKIGFTTIDVAQRAKDYSIGHEFDEHWRTAWSLRTPQAKAVEAAVHGQLMSRRVKYGGATEIFECLVREAKALIEQEASRYLDPKKFWAAHHAASVATQKKRLKELIEYVTNGWVGRIPPYDPPLTFEVWEAERRASTEEETNPLSHTNLCRMANRLGGLGYGMFDSGAFPNTKTLVHRLAAASKECAEPIISEFNKRFPEVEALMYSTRLLFQERARSQGRALLESLSKELCSRLQSLYKEPTEKQA
jgi:hypothetical protein